MTTPATARELRSLITDGKLELSLQEVDVPTPGPGEIVVRIEAAPINPSDQPLLLGPADLSTLASDGNVTTAAIPEAMAGMVAARIGKSLPAGNEGAGVVVAAGDGAEHLIGKTVAVLGGGMYTQYRKVPAVSALVYADGVTPAQGASAFVNPLTALGMVETMKLEGHTALVHTAAASNLGQMLNKVCIADGVSLVNIVRNDEQAKILTDIGAKYVVDSSKPDFRTELTDALFETGATIAFDAIGGGPLAGHILGAMEAALVRKTPPVGGYGSPVHKQVYIYGRLDLSPTTIAANAGFAWAVGGFLLTPFLMKVGPEAVQKLRQRVADEILTTFASSYTSEISLSEAIQPETIRGWQRKATGEKYLINPTL
ncbi:zinc-binding dehydrogenase [Sphingomonas bacterium]|uniref:zinc-binding dehydrogenase n=1 Tax=Sphingomonas bacterium TaxID=1895847 RepID=UPI00261C566F|nr:zinc-binding dehydrogenase [Sphingomonas bacterium]MDB5679239.1 oxidase [Sphingomonas bacterium]